MNTLEISLGGGYGYPSTLHVRAYKYGLLRQVFYAADKISGHRLCNTRLDSWLENQSHEVMEAPITSDQADAILKEWGAE